LGDDQQALSDYYEATLLNPGDGNAHYNLACLLTRQGQLELALSSLERAFDAVPTLIENVGGDPDLEPLHHDPGFQALIGSLPIS
jgi:tetratricopeptide (TPR) repeat protein